MATVTSFNKFSVSEITTPSNLKYLNNGVLQEWYQKVGAMDEYACDNLSPQQSQTTISYCSIFKQIHYKFNSLTNEGHRVFATFSVDSQGRIKDIEALVTAKWKENGTIWFSYALTNPHNLPLPGLQTKQQHGGVLAIVKIMLPMMEKNKLEAWVVKNSIPFCQKLGFHVIEDKEVNSDVESHMQATADDVRLRVSSLVVAAKWLMPEPDMRTMQNKYVVYTELGIQMKNKLSNEMFESIKHLYIEQ